MIFFVIKSFSKIFWTKQIGLILLKKEFFIIIRPIRLGLQNKPTAPLQKSKVPPTSVRLWHETIMRIQK